MATHSPAQGGLRSAYGLPPSPLGPPHPYPGHSPDLLPSSGPPESLIISQSRVQENRIHLIIPKDQIGEKDTLLGKGLDAAIRLTRLYRESLAPAIPPLLVEEKMIMDAGIDLPLQGAIDVLTADHWLPDLKTADKSKGLKDAVLKGISKEGLAAATDKALKFLAGYAISEARVIAVLGKPKHEWASEDIAILRGMASQLRDGQSTAEQLFPATEPKEERPRAANPNEESKTKRFRAPKAEAPAPPSSPDSLLPQAATPEDLEAIRLTCLEKEIDLELILEKWQVIRLEELDGSSAQQVREWLKGQ
jgi:hypothetical protein